MCAQLGEASVSCGVPSIVVHGHDPRAGSPKPIRRPWLIVFIYVVL
jgi:hypothetical protein